MARLLDLPPELLVSIFEAAAAPSPLRNSARTTSLSLLLVCRSLHPLTLPLIWRSLTLSSTRSVISVLNSPHLHSCAQHVRHLAFLPRDGRQGVGNGLGTSDMIDGREARKLLEALKAAWASDGGGGLTSLDVASVDGLRADLLEGEWLSDLRELVLGPGLLLPTNRPIGPLIFSFRLQSLALHNNHWQSLPEELLAAVLRSALPRSAGGEDEGLQLLDMSSTYDVSGSAPIFRRLVNPRRRKEVIAQRTEQHDDPAHGTSVLESVTSLILPMLETDGHLQFALAALSLCCCPPSSSPFVPEGWADSDVQAQRIGSRARQRLRYVELPALASASSAYYDALWAVLALLLRGTRAQDVGEADSSVADGLEEVGLRGWAGPHMISTIAAVVAASGLDIQQDQDAYRIAGRGNGRQLKVRLVGLTEEGERPNDSLRQLLDRVRAFGVEVLWGPRIDSVVL